MSLQKMVLKWISENPWQRCSTCCHSLQSPNSSYFQIEAAHVSLRRKGLLQKRGASMNTEYAITGIKDE